MLNNQKKDDIKYPEIKNRNRRHKLITEKIQSPKVQQLVNFSKNDDLNPLPDRILYCKNLSNDEGNKMRGANRFNIFYTTQSKVSDTNPLDTYVCKELL